MPFKLLSLFKSSSKLPVLMYHKVSRGVSADPLTIQASVLESHFDYLQKERFTPILLSELSAYHLYNKPLPPKPVMITFDDGYRNNYTLMYPLLEKYQMKANVFLVPAFMGKTYVQVDVPDEYITVDDIKNTDPAIIEWGLHSFDHKNYSRLTSDELAKDIHATKESLQAMGISFQPCLAFPFGAYPKKDMAKQRAFFNILSQNEVVLSFRIGNRLNPLPIKNPLLIQRQDIRGSLPVPEFIQKLYKGKGIFG